MIGSDGYDYSQFLRLEDVRQHTKSVMLEVMRERLAQEKQWGTQNHPIRPAKGPWRRHELKDIATWMKSLCEVRRERGEMTWRDILLEEVHEVFAEEDPEKQREELIQVMAVAAAMIDNIDRDAEAA